MPAPRSICILRLSAIGDVTHVLPVVHTLQARYPQADISWIVGRAEYELVRKLPGVEFIPFDKRGGFAEWRRLRQTMAGRRYDALLLMQRSARANLLSTAVRARRRIGFDRSRSREGHGLVINERIPPPAGPHVVDALMSFALALGADRPVYDWTLPSQPQDLAWAQAAVPGSVPFAVLSPCSSQPLRNWTVAGYAALADHLADAHGLRIVLCGGSSRLERETAHSIREQMRAPVLDLVGRDSLPGFLALLRRARLLVSPDSGPAHMATVAGCPVLGLYAATDPARSGPYRYREACVNCYAQALRQYEHRSAEQAEWGHKVARRGVMSLIDIDAAQTHADRLLAATAQGAAGSAASPRPGKAHPRQPVFAGQDRPQTTAAAVAEGA